MASSFLKPFAKPAQEVGERIFKGVVGDGATQVVPELARRTKLINDLNETFAPKLGAKTRKPQRRAIAAAINNGDLEPDMADKLLRDFDDEGYEGAFVLTPETGLYLEDPVACVDYSMNQ